MERTNERMGCLLLLSILLTGSCVGSSRAPALGTLRPSARKLAQATACPQLDNTDWGLGGSEFSTLTSVASSTDCCNACKANPNCYNWVYSKSGLQCYLKAQSAQGSGFATCSTGLVAGIPAQVAPCTQVANTDWGLPGSEFATLNSVATAADCCKACSANNKCYNWVYAGSRQQCYLKAQSAQGSGYAACSIGGLVTASGIPSAGQCKITISRPSAGEPLNLAEVQLYDANGAQIAPSSLTFTLSSQLDATFGPTNCNDGNPSTFCHTNTGDPNPTLTITYACAGSTSLSRVVVTNRQDCCQFRTNTFSVHFFSSAGVEDRVSYDLDSTLASLTLNSYDIPVKTGAACTGSGRVLERFFCKPGENLALHPGWKTDNLGVDGNLLLAAGVLSNQDDKAIALGAADIWTVARTQADSPSLLWGTANAKVFRTSTDLFIAFAGSSGTDWWDDVNFATSLTPLGWLHSGFYAQWFAVQADIDSQITAMAAKLPADFKIFIMGHSLGGAVSQIAGLWIQTLSGQGRGRVSGVYAIAAPEVAHSDPSSADDFFKKYKAAGLGDKTIWLINGDDLVPRIMTSSFSMLATAVTMCPNDFKLGPYNSLTTGYPACPDLQDVFNGAAGVGHVQFHYLDFYRTSLRRSARQRSAHMQSVDNVLQAVDTSNQSDLRSFIFLKSSTDCMTDDNCNTGCGVVIINNCGAGFFCERGGLPALNGLYQCKPKLADNAPCDRDAACQIGTCANKPTGACGRPCSQDSDCSSLNRFCELSNALVGCGLHCCRDKLADNAPCDRDAACKIGTCANKPIGACGRPCNQDSDCSSLNRFCELSNALVGCGLHCCRDKLLLTRAMVDSQQQRAHRSSKHLQLMKTANINRGQLSNRAKEAGRPGGGERRRGTTDNEENGTDASRCFLSELNEHE